MDILSIKDKLDFLNQIVKNGSSLSEIEFGKTNTYVKGLEVS